MSRADDAVRLVTAFGSVAELLEATEDGYVPTLILPRGRSVRAQAERLAILIVRRELDLRCVEHFDGKVAA